MCRKNKPIKKDLFILGNGFDLALDLKSDFSTYIKKENKGYSYSKILHFIKLFNEYTVKLTLLSNPRIIWRILRRLPPRVYKTRLKLFRQLRSSDITQRLHVINNILSNKYLSYLRINEYPKKFILRMLNRIINESINNEMSDFLNVKLTLKNNDYKYWLSKGNNGNSKINTQINNLADKWFNDLINLAKSISNVNFWDLLIIYQKEYTDQQDIHEKYTFNNWCDIEDTIKYFLTSIYNEPEYKNGQFHVNKLNYYFNDTDPFFRNCFQSYLYINTYLRLLRKIDVDDDIFTPDKSVIYSNNLYNDVKPEINAHYKYLNKKDFLYYLNSIDPFYINIGYLHDSLKSKSLIFLLQILFKKNINMDNLFSSQFLRLQLKLFENSFAKYLKSGHVIPYSKSEYVHKSFNLLNNLFHEINEKLPINNNIKNYRKKFEVIDFNYTKLDSRIKPREHIHGSLDTNNIIIGMGDTEINNLIIRTRRNKIRTRIHERIKYSDRTMNDGNHEDKHMMKTVIPALGFTEFKYSQLLNFTKTYRILEMSNKDDNYSFENKSFDNVDNIIFFGHSLGINDYPYFEAVFDRVQLYNSNVRLIFCYNKHNLLDKTAIPYKDRQISAIVNLLRRYGRTMNNRAHGDNLISKMLIENRIRFFDATNCVEKVLGTKQLNKIRANKKS